MLRGLKSLSYSKWENIVRNATADSDNDPAEKDLRALATYTKTGTKDQYDKIMKMIYKRMTDYPKIKHVKKSLMVIEHGLTNFHPKFASDISQHQSVIQRITKYRYYKNGETDIAGPVRELAAHILLRLSQDDMNSVKSPPSKKQPARQQEQEQPGAARPGTSQQTGEEEVASAEVTTTKEEQQAVSFEQWDEGSIEISGRKGINEGRLNGVYTKRKESVNDKPSYVKEGMSVNPIVLWYWPKNEVWMISREEDVGREQAYACVKCGEEVVNPADIADGKTWMVWNKEAGQYKPDNNIKVRSL